MIKKEVLPMTEFITNYYTELIISMISLCIIGIIIMLIPLLTKRKKKTEPELLGLTPKEAKELAKITDKEQLLQDTFALYKKVETAKSKFDYDTLKELLTDTLYKEEEKKLKQLKANKQKLVATNIKLEEIKILFINKKKETELIDFYLHTSEYNYIIDNKKNIIRGTDKAEYQIEYRITIEKNKDKYFKLTKLDCTGKWIKNN